MEPKADASSMAGIYNAMLKPAVPKTKSTYNYSTDKINYSRDISGVHFVYLNVWPDEENRKWLANDLKKVDPKTPVLLFEHDPPAGDYKHFTNPNGTHDINEKDKFENILSEPFKSQGILNPQGTEGEEKGLVAFLKAHPNIKAFFHGHNNWTEYYNYKGPDKDLSIPTFRVDSPMKGRNSAEEEKKLSFEFVVIDTQTGQMTVRECFWNKKKNDSKKSLEWGDGISVSLK
jgi:hypothetical protein